MNSITWSPVTSILLNKPPGTAVIGMPGSGKTYFLLNTAVNCLLTGCKVIYIDPKNDASVLKDVYKDIKITDINNIRPGALNPFKVLKDISTNVILSIISCICGDLSDAQLVDVSPIVNDFVIKHKRENQNVTFSMLADYLYASEKEAAQTIGTTLKINENSKYGRLIFGDCNDDFSIGNYSEVISLFGLPLPNGTNNNLTSEERFSSAIIYILCKKLNEVLQDDNKIPTVLIIDECHIVYSNPSISKIIDDFLVLGRSLNVCTVLATQNATHFPKGISQFVSTSFMFASSKNEATYFLNEFDNSSCGDTLHHDSIIEFLSDIDIGGAFMIDRKNRGGFIKIKSNLGVTSNPLMKKRT